MTYRSDRSWWAIAGLVLLTAGIAAAVAYNAGLSQGMAQVPVPAGSVLPGSEWHRPWGFGFLFPFAFFFFWVVIIRGLFWRRWGPWGGPWRSGFDYRDRFEEWHRRAHERMSGQTSAPDHQSR